MELGLELGLELGFRSGLDCRRAHFFLKFNKCRGISRNPAECCGMSRRPRGGSAERLRRGCGPERARPRAQQHRMLMRLGQGHRSGGVRLLLCPGTGTLLHYSASAHQKDSISQARNANEALIRNSAGLIFGSWVAHARTSFYCTLRR